MDTTCETKSTPQQRFMKYLDTAPGWAVNKTDWKWSTQEEALNSGNYVQLNHMNRTYLGVDLDYEGAGSAWLEHVLPPPTIIIVNPANYHANIFWELTTPVYWPGKYTYGKIRIKPVRYYRAIKHGFDRLLEGDSGYTCATAKNPFSKKWRTSWHNHTYTLGDLAEYVELSEDDKWITCNGNYAGRNHELFEITRKWAYKQVKKCTTWKSLYELVYEYAVFLNKTIIPEHWPEKGSLPGSEVCSICRSISTWIVQHKDDHHFRQYTKNIGALNLGAITTTDSEDKKNEIKQRQQLVHSKI